MGTKAHDRQAQATLTQWPLSRHEFNHPNQSGNTHQ
jgi:hypothetical protein